MTQRGTKTGERSAPACSACAGSGCGIKHRTHEHDGWHCLLRSCKVCGGTGNAEPSPPASKPELEIASCVALSCSRGLRTGGGGETVTCYDCGKQVKRAIRQYREAKDKRHKPGYRDVCGNCYDVAIRARQRESTR